MSTSRKCLIQYSVETCAHRERSALPVLRVACRDTDCFAYKVNVFWPQRNEFLSPKTRKKASLYNATQSGGADSQNCGLFLFTEKACLRTDRLEWLDSFSGMLYQLAPLLCFLQQCFEYREFHIHTPKGESCLFPRF